MRFCVQRKLYNDSAVYICKVWLFVLQQAHRESKEKTEPMLSTIYKKLAQRQLWFRVQATSTSDIVQEVERKIVQEVTSIFSPLRGHFWHFKES